MVVNRRRIAQALTAICGVAMFLPWRTVTGEGGRESVQGVGTDEGQIVLVVCLVTIGLIQVGWRPAWIGAGLAVAITARELIDLSGDGAADPASGLWITAGAAAAVAVLLVWEMFAGVSTSRGDEGGEAGSHGLSGPLGRRR